MAFCHLHYISLVLTMSDTFVMDVVCVSPREKKTILITLHRSNSIEKMCQKPLNFFHETSVNATQRLFFAENQNKCQLHSIEKKTQITRKSERRSKMKTKR